MMFCNCCWINIFVGMEFFLKVGDFFKIVMVFVGNIDLVMVLDFIFLEYKILFCIFCRF